MKRIYDEHQLFKKYTFKRIELNSDPIWVTKQANLCWPYPVKLIQLYLSNRKMSQNKPRRCPSHFILTLRVILETEQFSNIIKWDQLQGILHIKDPRALVNSVFTGYFKHQSLKSFVRQLNLYGFRKIVRKKQILIFKNQEFTKKNFQEGKFIKRRIHKKRTALLQSEHKKLIVIENRFCNQNQNKEYEQNTKESSNNKTESHFCIAPKPKIQSTCHLEEIKQQKCLVSKLESLQSLELLGSYYGSHGIGKLNSFQIFDQESAFSRDCVSIFQGQ